MDEKDQGSRAVPINMNIYIYIYVCVYIIYIYMYVYVCICICIYICGFPYMVPQNVWFIMDNPKIEGYPRFRKPP